MNEKSSDEIIPFMELLEQGDRVLDLGCGNGLDLLWLSRAGFQGMGVDASSELVNLARNLHVDTGVEIQNKNFLFLDLEPGSIDAVWANRSFSELAPESLQRLLAICFKGLKSGGALGAILEEGSGTFEESLEMGLHSRTPTRKVHLYSEKAICALLEQSGFQIKKIGRKPWVFGQQNSMLVLAMRI